jgi:5-formyltetrahydrofolate cyclo-ligase
VSPGELPADIRKRILALRKAQDPNVAKAATQSVCDAFLRALPKKNGLKLALYRALPGELDPSAMTEELHRSGAELFYPRIVDQQAKQLEFAPAPPGVMWVKGAYGIEEPASSLPSVPASVLGLIVVPGVAFSVTGERIGRGAGYYDRALKGAGTALKVALAFDFQVLQSLPQHSEDQKVDWVLTESRDLRNPRVAAWLNRP